MSKLYTPFHDEIKENQTGTAYVGKFITFVVTGTWLVSIGNLKFMPGDVYPYDLQGADGQISFTPEINFLEDVSNDPSVLSNRRVKQGKFIEVIVLKMS
jgi:hypothetical protein